MSNPFDGIEDLRDGGTLSESLDGYTERPAQIEMAQVVAQALDGKSPAVIEAGTGTGKSLGYLLPIVRGGQKAVISTGDKALQEQLFYKDIPFVQRHVQPFPAALVKGFSNYLCLDKVLTYRNEMFHLTEANDFEELEKFLADESNEWDGDFESRGAPVLTDETRSQVRADRDQCAMQKCPFYQQCYVRQMRQRADDAKVIVVNHDLLLLDAQKNGRVIPEHDYLVIDEAHKLEEKATQVFTVTVKELAIYQLLKMKEVQALPGETVEHATAQVQVVWQRLDEYMRDGKPQVVLSDPIEDGLYLASLISSVASQLEKRPPADGNDKDYALHERLVKRAENLAADLRAVFSVKDRKKYVYYLSTGQDKRGKKFIEANAAPLDVSSFLRERLFSVWPAVCTSATLAAGDLSYFRGRVGLDRSDTQECILPPVFDYPRKSLLYVPNPDVMPEYKYGVNEAAYQQALADQMLRLVQASRGRAFLLFASTKMLKAVYDEIADKIPYPVLSQVHDRKSRPVLTQEFRDAGNAVLFGLKSYWEGVDIAGEALSLVVIDRLPFAPPDDPIQSARSSLLKEAGRNAFIELDVNQVTLQLKQGLGRLIRTHQDRGVMAILDTRIRTKQYRHKMLASLPPAKRTERIQEIERFFGGSPAPAPEPTHTTPPSPPTMYDAVDNSRFVERLAHDLAMAIGKPCGRCGCPIYYLGDHGLNFCPRCHPRPEWSTNVAMWQRLIFLPRKFGKSA